jgi:hypothetical protein
MTKHRCHTAGCSSGAPYEVIDRWNGSRGHFCKRHGLESLRSQLRNEGKPPAEIADALREARAS